MSELLTASWDMRTLAPYGAVFMTDRLRQKKNAVAPSGATASLAQREGFEPSCGVIHKLISSQPRYDRFDTSAY